MFRSTRMNWKKALNEHTFDRFRRSQAAEAAAWRRSGPCDQACHGTRQLYYGPGGFRSRATAVGFLWRQAYAVVVQWNRCPAVDPDGDEGAGGRRGVLSKLYVCGYCRNGSSAWRHPGVRGYPDPQL